LLKDPAVARALDTTSLLAEDPATRLGAALALERALLDGRLVVPLVLADRREGSSSYVLSTEHEGSRSLSQCTQGLWT
jgi:hypothetical protein